MSPPQPAVTQAAQAEPTGPPVADPSRLELNGEAIAGGLMFGRVEPDSKVRVGRKPIRVGKEGRFLIPFRREPMEEVMLRVTFPDGAVLEKNLVIQSREFATDVVKGLPANMVDPEADTKKELRQVSQRLEKIRSKWRDAADYEGGFVWPVEGRLTARYGAPRVLNDRRKGIHWGVDLAAPVGRKVRAPAAGVVVFAEKGVPLAGTTVVIDHGHRLSSSFLHLSKASVKVGDVVAQGDLIGKVGKTGRATGSHLDWRMNVGKTRIDPQLLVPPMEE